ncbi:MAG: hypothetical protein J0H41_01405 [Rhizobiales bacterium]|nr:hypothetical protein [Hyphomicrobiales bacterium]
MLALERLYKDKLVEALNGLHRRFYPSELAFLAATSKPEGSLRDQVAVRLYEDMKDKIISREWNHVDLAFLNASQIPECLVEFELVTGGGMLHRETDEEAIKDVKDGFASLREWEKQKLEDVNARRSAASKRMLVDLMYDLEQCEKYCCELEKDFDVQKLSDLPIFGVALATCVGAPFPSPPFGRGRGGRHWPSIFKNVPSQRRILRNDSTLDNIENRAKELFKKIVAAVRELNLEILKEGVIRGSGNNEAPDKIFVPMPDGEKALEIPVSVVWWLVKLKPLHNRQ